MREIRIKTLVVVATAIVAVVFVFCLGTGAGSLEPNAPPGPTMKTLADIYAVTSSIADAKGPQGAGDGRWAVAMRIAEYPGSWDFPREEDSSKVLGLDYDLSVPYDPATGQATGVRVCDAVTITKNIDKASPGLGKALDTGQRLKQVVLRFYWKRPTGEKEVYYTITLLNARVVKFGHRVEYRGGDEYVHLEDVSFVWEQLEWRWIPDSVVEMIRWRTP